ncbi:nuclear transport factor 2 family protein [Reichenbachiella versicolor]|uniref:nuclear transport factor 2 family protein n=1 Tax=Reichenbachiella versicolor TaxID=1821036 RepID=UPI000D6E33F5|nr:nuclear transport factor 2 family protein [Reichenbachiella versicolor]
MYNIKMDKITKVIDNYFEGVYTGNIGKLKSSFHPNTFLYGDIKGNEYIKSLDDYLEGVQNRKSPKELNEIDKMEIISVEILGNTALAKVHLPMLGFNYYDFLSLVVIEGEWKIVNKVFTHVE